MPSASPDPALRTLRCVRELSEVRPWTTTGGRLSRLYLARERATGRQVVVKLPRATLAGPYWAPAFRREARLHVRLGMTGGVTEVAACHPAVAGAWRASGGDPAPLTTVRTGSDLSVWRPNVDDAGTVLAAFAGLVAATGRMHARGVVHRDIRPSNAVIDGTRVFLIDLTFARERAGGRLVDECGALTRYAKPLTAPRWAPPETYFGVATTPDAWVASDIYALGCSLYWLWCGRTPGEQFDHGALDAASRLFRRVLDECARERNYRQLIAAAHRRWPAPPMPAGPRGTRPPAALADVAMRMCAVDPVRRPCLAEVADVVATHAAWGAS